MDAEAIKRSLEDSGLRCTPQRYAVMAFLMKHNRHPTAAEIFEAVNRMDPRSSRATTYNNLHDLVQAGLVREVAFGSGASRYDRETDRHDHAICSKCGRLVDFDLPGTVGLIRSAARASRFKAESVHLTLIGLCPGCRERD